MKYSLKNKENRRVLRRGIIDGIPIGLGYLAVSFSLGVAAKSGGITPLQGFFASLLCNTSTGEHAVFTLMGISAAFTEVALITLIANARYLLMSFALSQRTDPKMSFWHRLGRNICHIHCPKRVHKPLVYLRRRADGFALLGGGNGDRHNCGKRFARQSGERAERCSVRYVYSHNHTPVQKG